MLFLFTNRWENNFDPTNIFFWMRKHAVAPPVTLVCLYIVFVFYGPKYMKDKEAFKWRKALVRSSHIGKRCLNLNLIGSFRIQYLRLLGICFSHHFPSWVFYAFYPSLFITMRHWVLKRICVVFLPLCSVPDQRDYGLCYLSLVRYLS